MFNKLNFTSLKKSNRNLHAYGSKNYLPVSGYFEANFEITRKEPTKFNFIHGQRVNLMNIDLATKSSVLTILNKIKKDYIGKASKTKSIDDATLLKSHFGMGVLL